MDHAGDVARKIARGFIAHPRNDHDSITVSEGDRYRQTLMVHTHDGGLFRVTIESVHDAKSTASPVTEDELYRDIYREEKQLAPSDR